MLDKDVGRIEGSLEALTKAVDAQTEKSEARYGQVYRELEALRLDMASVNREVLDLKSRAMTDAATLQEVRKWKERVIGMHMLGTFVAATFGGAIVAGFKWISVKSGWS